MDRACRVYRVQGLGPDPIVLILGNLQNHNSGGKARKDIGEFQACREY